MKILDIQKSTFLSNLTKSYMEGVYADTPTNRRLGRVGMSYNSYRAKVKGENPDKSDEDIIKNYGFKKGDIVEATLPNGKTIEAVFERVSGINNDSITIKVGKDSYWTTPDKIKLKERKKKPLTQGEKDKIEDEIWDLEREARDLEEEKDRILLEQDDALGALSQEERDNGNHPLVVEYSDLLTDVDKRLDKVYSKIETRKNKLGY